MSNIYIEKKIPQKFENVSVKDGKIWVDEKEILKKEQIYACLYYHKLKNITFLVRDEESYVATFLFETETEWKAFLDLLSKEMEDLKISEQNKKINGYAAALAAKLQQGIETEIFDNKEEEEICCCPVCGMQCDPNIPYCMECGATV